MCAFLRHILGLCFLLFTTVGNAQLSKFQYLQQDYNESVYLLGAGSHFMLSNEAAPRPEIHRRQGFTASLAVHKVDFDHDGGPFLYQNKLVFDLFLILNNQINGDGSEFWRKEASSLSTGVLGWFSKGWNVFSEDRFNIAVGGNLNDYFLVSSIRPDTSNSLLYSLEPQGYYFAGGPSLFADVALGKSFILHAHADYSMSYWRPATPSYLTADESYLKPHFGSAQLSLQSRWGLFAGIDYNWVINRGNLPNDTKRVEVLFGMRFPL